MNILISLSSRAVDVRSDNGATPAYFAAQEGRLDCLKFLIEKVRTVFSDVHLSVKRPYNADRNLIRCW